MEKSKILVDNIPLGLTFDDVLLIPHHSEINSRSDIDVSTRLSRNIKLKTPIISSPMDTVTETDMAIEMARLGGIGIIHRFQSIESHANMIAKVKRSEIHLIPDPIVLYKGSKIRDAKKISSELGINTFLIADAEGKKSEFELINRRKGSTVNEYLYGILTHRDIIVAESDDDLVTKYMTPREKLVVYVTAPGVSPNAEDLKKLMLSSRVEKIPIVTDKNKIIGLVTLKDLLKSLERPQANTDSDGQLIVGGAVGAKDDYLERAAALIQAGCDVLVVDIANGHSKLCIDTVRELKETYPKIDLIAGSIATGEGALNLIKAGADAIRCGIGSGSICITRVVSGCGVPQLSALIDAAPICKEYDIPLISDGGNRNSGNMCKALAAGASAIMLGRLVAGCEESPSKVIYRDGKLSKIYRGMAGYGANISKSERTGGKEPNSHTFTPEGVEGVIPYAGPLKDVLNQFVSGIRSGMSYCGASNIVELWKNGKFIRMTQSGSFESGVHDISKI